MSKGYKTRGGTNLLNFKVVGGTTEPDNPKENTIWVNTAQKITGWYFHPTQPENMGNGEVWFCTGATSLAAFDALKKNSIMVYPLNANQMVDGALVNVTAKSYQNGEWVDWILYLYDKGNLFENVTGGWDVNTYGGATLKFNASSVRITAANTGTACRATMRTKNKIDVTNASKLRVHVVSAVARNDGYTSQRVGLCDSLEFVYAWTQDRVAQIDTDLGGSDFYIELDVSDVSGSHYAFFTSGDGAKSSIYTEIDRIEVA